MSTKANIDYIPKITTYDAYDFTVRTLNNRGQIDDTDTVLVKMGYEIADRMDEDGHEARVSLYQRLFEIVMTLRDEYPPDLNGTIYIDRG